MGTPDPKLDGFKRRSRSDGKPFGFQMPLHYPKYSKPSTNQWRNGFWTSYFKNTVWPLLGMFITSAIFAMGAFLWNHNSP